VEVREIRPAEPKTLEEARGQVIAAYQDYLEAAWLESLRAKYVVNAYPEVMYGLTK
jgi:peptidyl-prolyl cis-trans isomerase SurA